MLIHSCRLQIAQSATFDARAIGVGGELLFSDELGTGATFRSACICGPDPMSNDCLKPFTSVAVTKSTGETDINNNRMTRIAQSRSKDISMNISRPRLSV
jgi:hypothetical protein